MYSHIRDTVKAYRQKDTIKLFCLPVPRYLKQWQDFASFLLTISLMVMLSIEPILHCLEHQHGMLFYAHCPEKKHFFFTYSVFSMFATFLYYLLLLDLSVISTRVSAYTLVCVRMLTEVALFLGAMLFTIVTFSCAASVLKQDNADFAGIHKGMYAFIRMVLGAYDAKRYERLHLDPILEYLVFIYCVVSVIFFLNMLIAQLSCAYSSVYEDMVGYARLERADTVVEVMPQVPKKRWQAFVDGLRLNKRLEFNQGDIGVAGGIQMREAANINPTTVDMIRRFGGSTSPEIQWPEDEADGEGEDKFERMEKLIQKTLQRVTKTAGHARRKGGGGGTGTGTGTGTGQSGSSDSVGEDHDDE